MLGLRSNSVPTESLSRATLRGFTRTEKFACTSQHNNRWIVGWVHCTCRITSFEFAAAVLTHHFTSHISDSYLQLAAADRAFLIEISRTRHSGVSFYRGVPRLTFPAMESVILQYPQPDFNKTFGGSTAYLFQRISLQKFFYYGIRFFL